MLTAILYRLSTNLNDRVEWGQKNSLGRDFLSLAAFKGLLSVLYPLVKEQPYFKNATKPHTLTVRPSEADWSTLSPSEQKALRRR